MRGDSHGLHSSRAATPASSHVVLAPSSVPPLTWGPLPDTHTRTGSHSHTHMY